MFPQLRSSLCLFRPFPTASANPLPSRRRLASALLALPAWAGIAQAWNQEALATDEQTQLMSGAVGLADPTSPGLEPELERQHAVQIPWTLIGQVSLPDGSPAAQALITTDAGGMTVADGHGNFHLQLHLPSDTESLDLRVTLSHGGQRWSTQSQLPGPGQGLQPTPAQLTLGLASACQPDWLPAYGQIQVINGVGVRDLRNFDDGTGPALYLSGNFSIAGGVSAQSVAKWDGQEFKALGAGLLGKVYSLAAFDDGSGSGLQLYAGGTFNFSGSVPINRLAKWDGIKWQPVGSGPNAVVYELQVIDLGDGQGPQMYAWYDQKLWMRT